MILEAVYEPIFLDVSHGFRPKRSCHTALKQLRREFNGTRWFVEGDIKGCFDNINHAVLVGLLSNKIKDARITKLIYKFLKAGYLEDWQYHKTYSGTPQGGIISPLLANIYLHELDKFVMKLKSEFDTPGVGRITPEYRELHNEIKRLSYRLTKVTGDERKLVLAEYKLKRQKLMSTPCTAQTDKKLKYIRYADDFLIAVKGSREDCQWIKSKLAEFIGDVLKTELSEEKTLITHSSKCASFLGYDVRVRRSGKIKVLEKRDKPMDGQALRHKLCKAATSVVSGFVAVKAEVNGFDVQTVRKETQQGFFSHAAQRQIALLLPVLFEQAEER